MRRESGLLLSATASACVAPDWADGSPWRVAPKPRPDGFTAAERVIACLRPQQGRLLQEGLQCNAAQGSWPPGGRMRVSGRQAGEVQVQQLQSGEGRSAPRREQGALVCAWVCGGWGAAA